MSAGTKDSVALWYSRYHSPGYALCDSEEEAAGLAWGMEDSGGAAVLGVQFADGRTIERESWPVFEVVRERYEQAEGEARDKPRPPVPVRKAVDPFCGRAIEIKASESSWLGKQP
jgi:hypothetical protein